MPHNISKLKKKNQGEDSAEISCLYRYHDYLEGHGYTDECGEFIHTGSSVKLRLETWYILKETPKGWWVDTIRRSTIPGFEGNPPSYKNAKFVLKESNKRFACPTIDEAMVSFIARKTKQIKILTKQLSRAERARRLMEIAKDEHETSSATSPIAP